MIVNDQLRSAQTELKDVKQQVTTTNDQLAQKKIEHTSALEGKATAETATEDMTQKHNAEKTQREEVERERDATHAKFVDVQKELADALKNTYELSMETRNPVNRDEIGPIFSSFLAAQPNLISR